MFVSCRHRIPASVSRAPSQASTLLPLHPPSRHLPPRHHSPPPPSAASGDSLAVRPQTTVALFPALSEPLLPHPRRRPFPTTHLHHPAGGAASPPSNHRRSSSHTGHPSMPDDHGGLPHHSNHRNPNPRHASLPSNHRHCRPSNHLVVPLSPTTMEASLTTPTPPPFMHVIGSPPP